MMEYETTPTVGDVFEEQGYEEDVEEGDYDIDYEEEAYNYQQQLLLQQEQKRQILLNNKAKLKNNGTTVVVRNGGGSSNGALAMALSSKVKPIQPSQARVLNGNNNVKMSNFARDLSVKRTYQQVQEQEMVYEDYSEEDPLQEEEEYSNENGDCDSDDYVQEGQVYYENGGGEGEEEEYPDMLQFCEAQFDEEDDEEARGLPAAVTGNYGNEEDYTMGVNNSRSRVTTNESGIRIVESSTLLEPEGEECDYEQYQFEHAEPMIIPNPPQRKVQMNKPRKYRPERVAAQELLRQMQNESYDDFRPNILARKLMGVPSQTVQASRPPPLLQKPQQSKPSTATSTISLESILRQQRPSNSMPRLQPKSAGNLVVGSQLKIKPNHIIPSQGDIPQRPRLHVQKLQMAPQQNKSSKFVYQQSLPSSSQRNNRSILAPILPKRPKIQQNYQYQQTNSSQMNNQSARTNGAASLLNSNRLSITSIQQQVLAQQQNALQFQSKPVKNVPRCPICKRTFATTQVLNRHMVLHGPVATNSEQEGGEYKCEECFDEFSNSQQLSQHMQSHDNIERYDTPVSTSIPINRCRVCYRTFTCIESLKAHSLMHDGEFKCRACRRGFSDWNTLEEHEATHKRYNCQWCEKYFMNSGNLKAHERIHTGERPYKCSDCPKAFKQLGGLQYHLKTNPSHKPKKYLKNDVETTEEDDTAYQYVNYEDYEDGEGILNLSGNMTMSLADIVANVAANSL